MHKFKKASVIVLSGIIVIALAVIACISPLTKYLIEKHDEKYTGRRITMDWAYVNPFTGYLHFRNIKIYEAKPLPAAGAGTPGVAAVQAAETADSIFFSAQGLSLNFALLKLLNKTYEISEVTLDHPRGILIQTNKGLNFDDLIERFSTRKDSLFNRPPIHLNILNVNIIDGEFHYCETLVPINYFIEKVNFESSGKRWNVDTIAAEFSFRQGEGIGTMKGNFTINVKNKNYRFSARVRSFDLSIIKQYLKELTNYGTFKANLEADINASGNLADQENITVSGRWAVNDFHFGKDLTNDYLSFDKFAVTIIELSPKKRKYIYDSVVLTNSFFKYERYDSLDNLQTMFGRMGSNITAARANPAFNLVLELGKYVKVLSRNFFKSDYKINHLAILNGNLEFNDFSLSEKFSVSLNPLRITADSIDKNDKWVNISLASGIKPFGNLEVKLSLNPKDTGDFDMRYHLEKMPAAMFNPYTITHTSFSLDRGTVSIQGTWRVRGGIIKSDNHLILIDPRQSRQLRTKDTRWIPVPLIMAFVRERGNVIDYEIPINGNLRNPKFRLNDILLDLLKNIFVKPATTPYGMQVTNIENEMERSLSWKWNMRNSSVSRSQEKFIERMADFLVNHPDEAITIYPQQYTVKEKEYILLFEAKKKYFLQANNITDQYFTKEDSDKVDRLSIRNDLFADYLTKETNDSLVFTIQERCVLLIDSATVNSKFEQLGSDRENAFVSYFKKRNVEKQIRFSTGASITPYNGFSFYKITYSDKFPKSLIKAHRQMNEWNDKAPRRKYKNIRIEHKAVPEIN